MPEFTALRPGFALLRWMDGYGQHVFACALVAPSANMAITDATPTFVNFLDEDISDSFP